MEEKRRHRLEIFEQSAFAIAIFIVLLFCAGCSSESISTPPETATEQLLLSTAGDRAMTGVSMHFLNRQRVYVDFTYLEAYHEKYIEGQVRDTLSRFGALLVPDMKTADIIVEARVGAYSIDTNSSFLGIPSIPIPIPFTSAIPTTPQLTLYTSLAQYSYAKIALLAYARKTGAHIYSSATLDGQAFDIYRSFLFISWKRTNIPEKNTGRRRQQSTVWQPQYELQNLPPPSSR